MTNPPHNSNLNHPTIHLPTSPSLQHPRTPQNTRIPQASPSRIENALLSHVLHSAGSHAQSPTISELSSTPASARDFYAMQMRTPSGRRNRHLLNTSVSSSRVTDEQLNNLRRYAYDGNAQDSSIMGREFSLLDAQEKQRDEEEFFDAVLSESMDEVHESPPNHMSASIPHAMMSSSMLSSDGMQSFSVSDVTASSQFSQFHSTGIPDAASQYSTHFSKRFISLIESSSKVLSLYILPSSVRQSLHRLLHISLIDSNTPTSQSDSLTSYSSPPHSITSDSSLSLRIPADDSSRVIIHSLLDASNILGMIVRISDERDDLFMYDLSTRRVLHRKQFSKGIQGLYLHEDFIVVQFTHCFEIYDNRFTVIFRNKMNAKCSVHLQSKILAYPYLNQLMWIKDFATNRKDHLLAHNSEVTTCVVDQKQQLIASASTNATLVRVYDLNTKQMVRELRRGQFTRSQILSISFSCSAKYLALSSASGTLHIYHMSEESKNASSMLKHLSYIGIKKFKSEWASLTVRELAVPNTCQFDATVENLIHVFAQEARIYYLIELVRNGDGTEEAKIRNELSLG